MAILKDLSTLLEKYPVGQSGPIEYGTSGFRHKSDRLPHVAFRVGIFASLRAQFTKAAVGVIITASHNPEQDNGVKMVDPSGGMLEESWEPLVTELANAPDSELEKTVKSLIDRFNIDINGQVYKVYVGRDTRRSSPMLCEALIAGIEAICGKCCDMGLLTTPQLHYIVRCVNTRGTYGDPTEDGYYRKLSVAYKRLSELAPRSEKYKPHIVVDGANGIGAIQLKKLAPLLSDTLTFEIVYDPNGVLNYQCGADFVKVNQREPLSVELVIGKRFASFDGDADRLIYYYRNSIDNKFHMLDGDKIAVLVAKYLKTMLGRASLDHFPVSIVQTAYANGSSTIYMRDQLHVQTFCVPTGVKHLHRQAEKCEIGVYFEANGHGTVLFSEKVQAQIRDNLNPSALELSYFIDLVNQTVGDAISDMLMVESILRSLDITIEEWDALYTDLPSRLLKQEVKDRSVVVSIDADRRCSKPDGLQEAIDKTVAQFGNKARSFVRPSGTEDVVRIYAEANTQNEADLLAKNVANLVFDFAHGIGEKHQI